MTVTRLVPRGYGRLPLPARGPFTRGAGVAVCGPTSSSSGGPRNNRVLVRSGIDNDDLPEEGKPGTESMESLFAQELEKRSLSFDEEEESSSGGQLDKSRALQSEGLEGLPDRARELLTLGSTFFLAFLPLGTVVAVIFATLAFGLGDSFVRQGGSAPPPYVDPDELLQPSQAPGAPFVRFRRNYTDYGQADGQGGSEEEAAAESLEPSGEDPPAEEEVTSAVAE